MTEVNLMANKLYQPLLIESVKATANIEQHRFIGFDGAYCGAGEKALGVSDVDIENGQYAPVAVLGTLLVISAGTINAGEPVASDANGKAVKATGDALVNGYAQDSVTEGQCLEAGAIDFIQKPVDENRLQEILDKNLGGR